MDTNVVVVVGGVEFQENSYALCQWSDFFEKGLRSGMKESLSKRFEFQDKDPKEWEMIREIVAPFGLGKITNDNVLVTLSWFDLLCSKRGLEECDERLLQWLDKFSSRCDRVLHIDRIIDIKETTDNYDLPKTKQKCQAAICSVLANDSKVLVQKNRFRRIAGFETKKRKGKKRTIHQSSGDSDSDSTSDSDSDSD